MLPNLGQLALHAHDEEPTGVLDSAIDKTKKRISLAQWKARRKAAPMPPPPPTLTDLPRQLIDAMVTQAALAARDTDAPAYEMCEWMKAFCRTVKVQGVAGCDDNWYRLALAAFMYDNKGINTPPEDWLRGWDTGFKSWRELFAGLCEAFYGFERIKINNYVYDRMERAGRLVGNRPFWHYVWPHLTGTNDRRRHGQSLKRFLAEEWNTRERDTLFDALMHAEINLQADLVIHNECWVDYSAFDQGARMSIDPPSGSRVCDMDEKVEELREAAKQKLLQDWRDFRDDDKGPMTEDTRPWMALVILFLFQGADWGNGEMEKYQALDRELLATIINRDIGTITQEEALAQARDLVYKQADPNYAGRGYNGVGAFVQQTRRWPAWYWVAQKGQDAALLTFLLDRGAKLPARRGPLHQEFFTKLWERTFEPDWRIGQEDTEYLIGMLADGGPPYHHWYMDLTPLDANGNPAPSIYARAPQWLRDAWIRVVGDNMPR